MFRFAHIHYLFILALIPVLTVLLVLFLVWRKKALNRFGEFHLLADKDMNWMTISNFGVKAYF